MASITWLDLNGKRHKPREKFSDIESLRSYIVKNRDKIKIVELLDCEGLKSLCVINPFSFEGLLEDCKNLVEVKEVIGTLQVEDMSCMFYGCKCLESVPYFDTPKVNDMNGMFYGCSNLESVPYFDTPKVKGMSYMFSCCGSLKLVPLFDTSNVEYVKDMFKGCSSLKYCDVLCDEYTTRLSVMKIYGSLMLKELNKLWQK